LDSSLIAAFLSERDPETLTKRQLRKLRRTLAKLAAGADHDEQLINESLPGSHIDDSSRSSEAIDRNQDGSSARSTITDATSPLGSPCSTSSSTTSFSFARGFLQAAFPELPRTRVERAITNASHDSDGIDMERAIQLLIAHEDPRNLAEDGGMFPTLDNELPATRTEGRIVNAKGKKKKKHRLKIVTMNDIRQQRLTYESASGSSHSSHSITSPTFSDVDIWTFVSSISAQLAELLPPHSETFFKSFFHAPEARTPATAIRRALAVITSAHDNDLPPLDRTVLLNLQDILRSSPEFKKLSAEERKQLLSDVHLCLHAVASRADDGLDLVWLLHSLDVEVAAGWKIAPCHQAPRLYKGNHSMETSENSSTFTSPTHQEPQPGRPPGRPPFQSREGWSLASSRKRRTIANGPELSILAPDDLDATFTHQIGFAKANDLVRLKERLDELETRHRELTTSAARARRGGNSKNLGVHVAVYYDGEVGTLFCATLLVNSEHNPVYVAIGTPITRRDRGR
jgi:hypothetical protein